VARFNRQSKFDDSGCLIWQGRIDRTGYGRFDRDDKTSIAVHRFVWQFVMGREIPEGMQVDHVCHTEAVQRGECVGGVCGHRRCCNPQHLELVTASENTLRQDHAERKKTHCPKGHEYNDENTLRRDGRRYCKTCEKARLSRRVR
jgi:hypothetical protein